MNPLPLLLLLAAGSFAVALWLTGHLRSYALRSNMVDEVTLRSSHQTPTPRGGGASIVVVSGLGIVAAALSLGFPIPHSIGLIGGAAVIALIGWIDDRGHVSPQLRLGAHFVGAIWAVCWIGPFNLDLLALPPVVEGVAAGLLSTVAIVWMVNLFNFMDGIDGIAGSEAVCVGFGAAFLLWTIGYGAAETAPFVLVGAATLGFLYWNWPPAKVFLGDAGSGFLGFSLAVFVLIASQLHPAAGVALIILLGVFIADATVTLFRRAVRGEKLYQAHRSHAYQHLARRTGRHLPVTLAVIAVNIAVLLPVGWLTAAGFIGPLATVAAVYLVLAAGMLAAGAGRVEP